MMARGMIARGPTCPEVGSILFLSFGERIEVRGMSTAKLPRRR